jgi:hypothetical protein
MPGIFNWAGQKLKDGAEWLGNKFRWGAEQVGKLAKRSLPYIQTGLDAVSIIPSAIGTAAGGLSKVVGSAQKWIDAVPIKSVKDKLTKYADSAQDMIGKGQTTASQIYHDKVAPHTGAIQQTHDKLKDLI